MSLLDDINSDIANVSINWTTSKAQSATFAVPKSEDLSYSEGKYIDATYLYADMIDSSKLVEIATQEEVASVISAFLKIIVRVIRSEYGHIRSFDGDRVMGIFAGPNRINRATTAAFRIRWAVEQLDKEVQEQFAQIERSTWSVRAMTGIVTDQALLVRAGIRNNSDLVSIGLGPNLAAKLSDVRDSGNGLIALEANSYEAMTVLKTNSDGYNIWTGPHSIWVGSKFYNYYTTAWQQQIT